MDEINIRNMLSNIHGLSGKFSNVQNSPPLRRPSGARQVLHSSNEFGELSRENRIALAYLIIVLCFFMWAHVWRVWRFSWDKKMSGFHEQRICVKFCVKIGKSVTEAFEMLKTSFREEPMGRTQTYEWWKRFKEDVRDGHQRRNLKVMVRNFVKSSFHIVVWQFDR